MLIAMFILLMRTLNRRYSVLSRLKSVTRIHFKTRIVLMTLLFLFIKSSNAQDKILSFEVWKNRSHIGNISMTEKINSDSVVYDLSSTITAKAIIKMKITGIEKSVYKNGILVYSSISRELNSNLRVNKKLLLNDGKYDLINKGRISTLPINKITDNLVTLYFNEPVNLSQVYCDNHQSMAGIVPLESGKYRVTFPDGSYNIFYYQDGKCKKVDAFNSLYKVQLISTL